MTGATGDARDQTLQQARWPEKAYAVTKVGVCLKFGFKKIFTYILHGKSFGYGCRCCYDVPAGKQEGWLCSDSMPGMLNMQLIATEYCQPSSFYTISSSTSPFFSLAYTLRPI